MGLEGESEKDAAARKASLAQLLKQVINRKRGSASKAGGNNASQVCLRMYSGKYGLFRSIEAGPLPKDRSHDPLTKLKHERHGGNWHRRASRDGEIYMIDEIDDAIDFYIFFVEGVFETDESERKDFRDEIRMEIVGPHGTCLDCQTALRLHLTQINRTLTQNGLGDGVKVSLNTRWDGEEVLLHQRDGNGSGLSSQYGHKAAKRKPATEGSPTNGTIDRYQHKKMKLTPK